MISDLTSYIDDRVKEIDSDLIRWDKDLFNNNDENIPRISKYYKLYIGDMQIERDGNGHNFRFPASLKVSQVIGRDYTDGFASIYDKAIDILESILDPKNIYSLSQFSDIEPITISPSEENSNDNIISCTLQFNLRSERSFN